MLLRPLLRAHKLLNYLAHRGSWVPVSLHTFQGNSNQNFHLAHVAFALHHRVQDVFNPRPPDTNPIHSIPRPFNQPRLLCLSLGISIGDSRWALPCHHLQNHDSIAINVYPGGYGKVEYPFRSHVSSGSSDPRETWIAKPSSVTQFRHPKIGHFWLVIRVQEYVLRLYGINLQICYFYPHVRAQQKKKRKVLADY